MKRSAGNPKTMLYKRDPNSSALETREHWQSLSQLLSMNKHPKHTTESSHMQLLLLADKRINASKDC